MALYVNFERKATIDLFLKEFYKNTSYGYGIAGITYHDQKCTKTHCIRGYRSFDDLLELVQTYYPSTTPKIMIHKLLKLKLKISKTLRSYPHLATCSTMNRIRYIPYGNHSYHDINVKMKDSKYTWSELLKLINVNTHSEFLEYIK